MKSVSGLVGEGKRGVLYIFQNGADSRNLEAKEGIEGGRGESRKDVPVVIEKGRLVRIVKVDGSAFVALKRVVQRGWENAGWLTSERMAWLLSAW